MTQRYLRKLGADRTVYGWTAILARRDDMIEVDRNGNPIEVLEAKQEQNSMPETVEVPTEVSDANLDLENMSREELVAMAAAKGIRVHWNTRPENIIARIKAHLEAE